MEEVGTTTRSKWKANAVNDNYRKEIAGIMEREVLLIASNKMSGRRMQSRRGRGNRGIRREACSGEAADIPAPCYGCKVNGGEAGRRSDTRHLPRRERKENRADHASEDTGCKGDP